MITSMKHISVFRQEILKFLKGF